jgi:hypothetical protein
MRQVLGRCKAPKFDDVVACFEACEKSKPQNSCVFDNLAKRSHEPCA